MALLAINVTCSNCNNHFKAIPKRSFLGFQKLTCPSCQTELTYPLTNGYRIIYWVLLILMCISILSALSQGNFAFPSLFAIAMIFALLRDRKLRKKIAVEVTYK